ncbi:MAG: nicotinamide mononucleotide transporter family protein [Nocardioidaceae bacterium]
MNLINWLFDAQLTIGGHPILWREIIGNAFGLASAIGGMRRKVWAWPVGIVGNALLFTVFLGVAFSNPQGATLYGQASRQVFFIVVSVYGWWRWQQTRSQTAGKAVAPRWATASERLTYLPVALVAVALCFVIFRAVGAGFPVPWWYYLADAWIFVGSVLATYAMARGWVDFWLAWVAVDLVGVPELIHFRFYPSATLYAVYAGFVIWGFFVWRRVARDESAGPLADRSSIETVGARRDR